jgi:hypothetical protein
MDKAVAMDPMQPEGSIDDPFAQHPQLSNPVQPLQSPRTPGVPVQAPVPTDPALQAEYAKLTAQLQTLLWLKQGAENPNSIVGVTITTYGQLLDGLIKDVAVETHRSLSLGLDTLDSVRDRVHGAAEAAAAQTPTKAQMSALGSMAPTEIKVETPSGKVGKGTKDIYGRTGGASAEATTCPICLQQMAASRFASHLERCLGKGRTARGPGGIPAGLQQRARLAAAGRASVGMAPAGAQRGQQVWAAGAAVKAEAVKKKKPKAKSLAELTATGAAVKAADDDDDDVPISLMVAKASGPKKKVVNKGVKAAKEPGVKKPGKTKSLSEIFASPPAKAAKVKKGKKAANAEAFPMGTPFPMGGIPFEDFGGDGFNFDDADAFDLNFEIPGAADGGASPLAPASLAPAVPPIKKKRTSPGTAKAGAGGRGGRGTAVGGRGTAVGGRGTGLVPQGSLGQVPLGQVPLGVGTLPGVAAELGGRGGRGGRGGKKGGRGTVPPVGLPGKPVAVKPKAGRGTKPPKETAAPKRKKVAAKTTKAPQTSVAGTAPDAFDDVFGTGGALEMPGDAMAGMPDDDLELLFDGGTNRTGGGDQPFGSLFD